MYIYLNDRLVSESEATVSVFDHGFLYGDGVYETMRSYEGMVFMLDEHLTRLERSASSLGLGLPMDAVATKAAVYETLRANSLSDAYIRITVSRGPGPLGLDPGFCCSPTFCVITGELREYPEECYAEGVKLIISRTRRNLKEALDPRIKSLNFLNNIQAKREAIASGVFDALMLNHEGKLTECTVSNVFFVKDGVLFTPSVECGILDGITRGHVIELAKHAGITVREGEYTRDLLYRASEVFVTNTTMEVMPVGRVDHRAYAVGDTARLLLRLYRQSTGRQHG